MEIKEYFKGWIEVINIKELSKVLKILNTKDKRFLCPQYNDIFRAFNLCPYDNLKVIMIGQDPYPQKGVATGILFGNRKEVSEDKLSPSLKVVKKSVLNLEDSNKRLIFDNTMEEWARQGILMINAALSCEMNKVGSHTMMWRPFVSKLLDALSSKKKHIVYVLFGNVAQSFENHIADDNKVIKIEHPAYFARIKKDMPNNLFTAINDYLEINNKIPVKWYRY